MKLLNLFAFLGNNLPLADIASAPMEGVSQGRRTFVLSVSMATVLLALGLCLFIVKRYRDKIQAETNESSRQPKTWPMLLVVGMVASIMILLTLLGIWTPEPLSIFAGIVTGLFFTLLFFTFVIKFFIFIAKKIKHTIQAGKKLEGALNPSSNTYDSQRPKKPWLILLLVWGASSMILSILINSSNPKPNTPSRRPVKYTLETVKEAKDSITDRDSNTYETEEFDHQQNTPY